MKRKAKILNVLLINVRDDLEDVCASFKGAKVVTHPIESAEAAIATHNTCEWHFSFLYSSFLYNQWNRIA